MRDKEHSKYETNIIEIISESLRRLNGQIYSKEDAVCVLPISTPLRKVKHVEHSIDAMDIFGVDTVLSVQEEFSPCYHHDRHGLRPINVTENGQPRLERDAIYRGNGSIILSKLKNINSGSLYGKNVGHITMLPEESVKLNSDFEYWLAEEIIKKNTK